MTAEEVENSPEKEMSIWDHIGELRARLLWGMAALLTTTAAVFFLNLASKFIDILSWPAQGMKFIAIDPTEAVGVFMRVSLLGGFILALPIIVYQILAFVVPGLYDNEKRWLFIAIPVATLLFIFGVGFSYFVMLPAAIPFLRGFLTGVAATWRLSSYIEFVTNLMFWIGISFEAPLVVYILAKFHLVTAGQLLKQWRFAVVIIAVIAAVVTPTVDIFNMALLMAPLFGVYFLSVLFAALAR